MGRRISLLLLCTVTGCGSFDAAPSPEEAPAPDAGAEEQDGGRPTSGAVALYTFEEAAGDVVHDRSGIEPALDLRIADANAVSWGPDGLTLTAPVLVDSIVAAMKIFDACAATNAVSVEAWIRPTTAAQAGPARIVTMSDGPVVQNFLLGIGENFAFSEASRYVFRVSDPGGATFLVTDPDTAKGELQHVVATADFGQVAMTMYVDGVPVARGRIPAGHTVRDTWIGSRPLVLGGERQVADRRFLGTYSRVAIYARALSADDVRERFADKPRP